MAAILEEDSRACNVLGVMGKPAIGSPLVMQE